MSRNTLSSPVSFLVVLACGIAGACTDRPVAPGPDPFVTAAPLDGAQIENRETLARTLARALRSPVLRAYLRAKLQGSPFREQKLHFQRFLHADGQHALLRIATETATRATALAGAADAAMPLEVYLPVPQHRVTWMGDGRLLVATEASDGDVPVAYDTAGNRFLLSRDTPPSIPVLALVPVETDFSAAPNPKMCLSECGGGGGGSGGAYPPPPAPVPAPGLYMTQAHFTETFEGWLKGSPELEIHILGQKGQTDSLTDYQCAGERQGTPYYFDQNGLDWSSSVMLFSQAQLNDYHTQHPGQNIRVYVVEDDDTACQIKTGNPDVLAFVDSLYNARTAGRDTTNDGLKTFKTALSFQKLLATLVSFINTNDELVGNAVADSVAREHHAGFNWVVKNAQNVTNGWITLEMR